MTDQWLTTLITDSPQSGFELAVKLSRVGVKLTQPSDEVRKKLRPIYEDNADSLIAASHVVATHYHTIAAANNHWK